MAGFSKGDRVAIEATVLDIDPLKKEVRLLLKNFSYSTADDIRTIAISTRGSSRNPKEDEDHHRGRVVTVLARSVSIAPKKDDVIWLKGSIPDEVHGDTVKVALEDLLPRSGRNEDLDVVEGPASATKTT